MPAPPNSSNHLNWLSRTIAILIFMVGPGLIGSWLDKQLDVSYFTPLGFACGIFFATILLIFYAKQFTPDAKGRPIPFDDEEDSEDSTENRRRDGLS